MCNINFLDRSRFLLEATLRQVHSSYCLVIESHYYQDSGFTLVFFDVTALSTQMHLLRLIFSNAQKHLNQALKCFLLRMPACIINKTKNKYSACTDCFSLTNNVENSVVM